jgi:phenol 2-monooxygenase
MFSARPKDPSKSDGEGVDPAEFQEYYARHLRYTAGTETRYAPSIISAKPIHQHLAKELVIGMRFHSAAVIRLADAKPVQLGHTIKADGRWRLFVFAAAEDPVAPASSFTALCQFLAESRQSPIRR